MNIRAGYFAAAFLFNVAAGATARADEAAPALKPQDSITCASKAITAYEMPGVKPEQTTTPTNLNLSRQKKIKTLDQTTIVVGPEADITSSEIAITFHTGPVPIRKDGPTPEGELAYTAFLSLNDIDNPHGYYSAEGGNITNDERSHVSTEATFILATIKKCLKEVLNKPTRAKNRKPSRTHRLKTLPEQKTAVLP